MVAIFTCPDIQTLQRFILGRGGDAEAEAWERHLEHCDRCLAVIHQLEAEDSLIEAMQAHSTVREETPNAAVRKLAERLKALRPAAPGGASAEEPTRDQTPSSPQAPSGGRPGAAFDFLAPPEKPGELGRLGPYHVLRVLGAGGMGVVFLAHDPQLERLVALKAMLPALASNPSARKRFLREARAAAAIKHDHIVTIYQVGEDRGAPFLAMEFLEGESLGDRLQHERRLPVKEVLRIGREMADGLAAAHTRGLIHRDVKPGNVWLEGDRGRVKILDFGLARAAEGAHLDDGTPAGPVPDGPASSLTQQGVVVGTPAYMAPEQADGRPVDARSDLFSLGCVLYRMAAGEPPFQGKGAVSLLLAAATETPAPPRRLNPDLPESLCDLITRLLSKKAGDRPPSAQAVVEAIRAIEQDESPFRSGVRVAAPARTAAPPRPPTPTPAAGSSWRVWIPVTAAVLLGMLAYAAYLFGPAVLRFASGDGELVIEIDDPRVETVVDQTGVTILDKAKDRSYTVRPGRRDLKAGDYELVVKEVGGDVRLFTKEFTITRGGVTSVKVTLAANPPPAIPAAKAALLYSLPFWDAQQGFPASIFSTGISSDGRLFFGAGDAGPKGTIRVWDLNTGEQVRELVPGGDPWNSVAQFLPGGKYLVAAYSLDKDLYLWDVSAGKVVRKFVGHTKPLPSFTVSPDGKRILSWDDDQTMRLWDVETGEELRKLEGRPDKASGAFSPDGKQILTFGPDQTLRLWDVETGEELRELGGRVTGGAGCFSPDGQQVLSYGPGKTIRLLDLETGNVVRRFEGSKAGLDFAGFVAGGRLVVGRSDEHSDDKKLRVWERATGKLVSEIDYGQYGGDGPFITASPDGRLALVPVVSDNSVRALDLLTGKEMHHYDGCRKARDFSFSPDGTLVVAGSFRAGMFVFRLPSDKAGGAGQRSGK